MCVDFPISKMERIILLYPSIIKALVVIYEKDGDFLSKALVE
jgi:hypothetical protein